MCSHSQTHTPFSSLFTARRRLISDLLLTSNSLKFIFFLSLCLSISPSSVLHALLALPSSYFTHVLVFWFGSTFSSFGSFSFRPTCTSSTHPSLRPWSPPPSPVAVLTPARNSSSSLSSHVSSETANVGSLLILADGMVVEHAEDFYRMQVSRTTGTADILLDLSWLMKTKMFTFTYHDCRLAPPPPASAPPTQHPPR